MRVVTTEQLTDEWRLAHAGVLSGSSMATIMNGGHKAWCTLLERKKLEIEQPDVLLGEEVTAPPLEWGKKHEPKAIGHYELIFDVDVERPGFILHDEIDYIGCSPDFLNTNHNAVGEAKCPYNEEVHAMTVVHGSGVEEYKPQVQCELLVTGYDILHFLSYDPRYKDPIRQLIVITVERDEDYINKMLEKCAEFMRYLQTDTRPAQLMTTEIPNIF